MRKSVGQGKWKRVVGLWEESVELAKEKFTLYYFGSRSGNGEASISNVVCSHLHFSGEFIVRGSS